MTIFVDTSGWGASLVKSERHHEKASSIINMLSDSGGRIITSEFVLMELYTLFISPIKLDYNKRVSAIEGIRRSNYVTVIPIDDKLVAAAWELARARADKDYSVVDCASFVIMSQLGITQVLTADHHFSQAGFEKLL